MSGIEPEMIGSSTRTSRLASVWPLSVPVLFTLAMLLLASREGIRFNPYLLWSFFGAAGALAVWAVLLLVLTLSRNRSLRLNIDLRKQHGIQACAQGSVFVIWGWFWPPVYDAAPLILAQLLFAYAFDSLLSYSRRDGYTLGFGPFPVIFSINLFLWFRPDWFALQFAMVASGFLGKELIRWDRDDRRDVHIFNPSAFTLGLFSLALILTGMSDTTRGQDIAITQFYPPQMFLALFLIGLPGQFFFGVTAMTMSAVVTTYVFGLIYFAVTGVYFFYDSYIPIAVFLGMHLLFTDPSTSPRTELGRIMFGVLYGLSSVALYQLLGAAGIPTFYDKLLQVPILNLSVKLIDGAARARALSWADPSRLGRSLTPQQRRVAYMTVWTLMFVAITAAGGVGDHHPGQWLPFWQQACQEQKGDACAYLVNLQSIYCNAGSGWACNEAGVLRHELSGTGQDREGVDRAETVAAFERGCRLGFDPACRNFAALRQGDTAALHSAPPKLADYPIILRGSKGPVEERDSASLYARACVQGWTDACARTNPAPDD